MSETSSIRSPRDFPGDAPGSSCDAMYRYSDIGVSPRRFATATIDARDRRVGTAMIAAVVCCAAIVAVVAVAAVWGAWLFRHKAGRRQ